MSEVFRFVDATHLISKASVWTERDKGIKADYEKLNKEMRIGSKGQKKFWYGYKQEVSIDMQSGLIDKVAVCLANETDTQGFKRACPRQGAVYSDKGYCTKPAKEEAKKQGVHLAAVKRNNMEDKNKDKDKWHTKLRAPYERAFSKWPKRVRVRGRAKNQFSAFMQTI